MKASVFRCLEKIRVAILALSLLLPCVAGTQASPASTGDADDSVLSNQQQNTSSSSRSRRSNRSNRSDRNSSNNETEEQDSASNRNTSSRRGSSRDRSSSKDKEKDKSKEKTSDKNKAKDSAKGGETAKPSPQKSKTLTGKAPGSSQKSSKGAADGFSAVMAEGFGAAVAEDIAILYLYPMDISVMTDEEFEVVVRMENLTSNAVDGFRFTLMYSTPWLDYMGCDTGPLEVFARDPQATLRVDTSQDGRLTFSGRFDGPASQRKADLLNLRFRSRQVAGYTKLKFLLPPKGEAPALSSRGENILGRPEQSFYGVVDTVVAVKHPPEIISDAHTTETAPLDLATAMPHEMPKQSALVEGWIGQTPVTKADAPVRLLLQSPETNTFAPGEDFWVDLVLINDEEASFESLCATIRFDPDRLTVLDEDEDNWTQLGVNIWDGAFHESYPFDFMRRNEADNQRGLIRYSVARNAGSWPFPTGVFARIHFQVKDDSPDGNIAIRLERRLQNNLATYVRSMGLDRLETTWNNTRPPAVALKVRATQPLARTGEKNSGTTDDATSQTAQAASAAPAEPDTAKEEE